MSASPNAGWKIALIALAACALVLTALLAALLSGYGSADGQVQGAPKGGERRSGTHGDRGPSAETGRIATERVVSLGGPVDPSSSIEDAVRAAVDERLEARRAAARGRFVSGLESRAEARLGRPLSDQERTALEKANREYFDTLDDEAGEGDEGERRSEERVRASAAKRARFEALVDIVGSEEDASRLIGEAMNDVSGE